LLGPVHRGCGHAVGGEDAGSGEFRSVVFDHDDVDLAGGLQARWHAGGAEACRGGDAGGGGRWVGVGVGKTHGATPCMSNPVFSSRPKAMFIDWTAAPAVPLVRLSSAAVTITRLAWVSKASCNWTWLEACTAPVVGHWPSGSKCTNSSPA